jgi:hypothetical protein
MKKITLALLLLTGISGFSQEILIDPAGDGGFESGTTFESNGWTVANQSQPNKKWVVGTGQEGYTGQRCAFIGNNETTVGNNAQARTLHFYRSIAIPAGAENIVLNFDYKQAVSDFDGEDFYDYIAVYTSDDAPEGGELPTDETIQFGPFPENDLPDFEMQTITLPNSLAGTITNLIFTFISDDVNPRGFGAVDNISLTYVIPTCPTPTGLSFTNLNDSGLTLNWTAADPSPSLGYEIHFSQSEEMPTAETPADETSMTNTKTLTGLNSSDNYFFYVRAKCSASDMSNWSSPIIVKIPCAATDVPFSFGFEVNESLECVAIEDLNEGSEWQLYTEGDEGVASGTNSGYYEYDADLPANDWFFIGGFNLVGGEGYKLSFKYKSAGGTVFPENLEVKYGMAPVAAMMTESVVDHPNITTELEDAFLDSDTVFTPSENGVYYFGFHCYSDADMFALFVDDILIDAHLSVKDIDKLKMNAYPNPVKDLLHLTYDKNIQDVEIYNILGQKVLAKTLNASSAEINLSQLPSGNYLVKVKSDDVVQTLKVIKK